MEENVAFDAITYIRFGLKLESASETLLIFIISLDESIKVVFSYKLYFSQSFLLLEIGLVEIDKFAI